MESSLGVTMALLRDGREGEYGLCVWILMLHLYAPCRKIREFKLLPRSKI